MQSSLGEGGVTHAEPANHRAPLTPPPLPPESSPEAVLGRLGTKRLDLTAEREPFAALAPLMLTLMLAHPSRDLQTLRS